MELRRQVCASDQSRPCVGRAVPECDGGCLASATRRTRSFAFPDSSACRRSGRERSAAVEFFGWFL